MKHNSCCKLHESTKLISKNFLWYVFLHTQNKVLIKTWGENFEIFSNSVRLVLKQDISNQDDVIFLVKVQVRHCDPSEIVRSFIIGKK